MRAEVSRLLGRLDMVRAQRKISGKVKERIMAGTCLGCSKPAVKRGVCLTCYARFYMAMIRMGDDEKSIAYEEKKIRQGLILPAGQARKIKSKNLYA